MNAELQAKARKLYLQTDLSKTEIATVLGIPIRTLHYWVGVQRWDIQKQCVLQAPSVIVTNCYQILANFTGQLLAPERRDTLMTHKEAETIHKLTVTISKLKARTTLGENMDIFNNFLQNIRSYSPQLADLIAPHVTAFIAAGATAPTAAPAHAAGVPTQAEMDEEAHLDLEEELEEQREKEQAQTPHTHSHTQTPQTHSHTQTSAPASHGAHSTSPSPSERAGERSAPSARDGERFARAA
ncbi:MAG: hypothetical protein IAE95_13245 [Chitinophagaceae bacterium]|nr:hypothetical protein [Chitinophagaceae bacterium]